MEENIEVKDVQKTEYLDKNGLDMLWAKIKENTNNQVEVERNRAVAKENSIADTKADKSALDNYVLNTAITALEQKVTANTTAIEGKQDAGKYIPYKGIEGGLTYYLQDSYNIMCQKGFSTTSSNYDYAAINYNCVKVGYGTNRYIQIVKDNIQIQDGNQAMALISANSIFSRNENNDFNFQLTKSGINLLGGDDNHVLTSNGSTIDITEYAKKSEITTGGNVDDIQVNGTSVVENKVANIKPATKESLGVVKVGDGLNVTDGTISVDPEYFVNMKSYGVEWDVTVADPACTRIGNPLLHKQLPIQSEYKGCLVKNGKVNYYLDPNDWSKKADGAPSVLDGTDGDVMVHIPKFYGKSGSNGNKRWVRIATTKIDSSWVEIPEMFVSAYRITTYTDADKTKIASVVNTTTNYRGGGNPNISSMYDQYLNSDKFRTRLGKPRTDVDVKEMRANANNSGQELLCYEFYKWVFYWAYVIEYANFNSLKEFNSELTSDGYHQGGLGIGVSWDYYTWYKYSGNSPITPCGYTNEFGNFSGVKQILIPRTETDDSTIYETTLQANRWRGFENPFGDIVTFLDGIILDNGSANQGRKVYTTSDSSKFGDDISVMNTIGTFVGESGTIKEFDLGETGEIIPQSVDGTISYNSYKCGYSYGCAFKGNLEVIVGGRAGGDFMSGLCSFRPYNEETDGCGFRSVVLVH